eukprot:scaffold71716_cov53-Phaeocystis_antarctica.AAC.1
MYLVSLSLQPSRLLTSQREAWLVKRSEIGDGGRLLARAREAVAGTPATWPGSVPGAPRLPKFVIRNPRGSSAATLDGVLLSTLRITS